MKSNWYLVAIAVIAAIVGGVGGAALSNSRNVQAGANPAVAQVQPLTTSTPAALTDEQIDRVARVAATTAVATLREYSAEMATSGSRASGSVRSQRGPRRVYYDYNSQPSAQPTATYAPQKQSFWKRHRDLLTVAIGTGIGTAIGAGTGGKKGALIGAGVGAGGSALYTYGIRDRSRND